MADFTLTAATGSFVVTPGTTYLVPVTPAQAGWVRATVPSTADKRGGK